MKTRLTLKLAAVAFAALAMTPAQADLVVGHTALSVDNLRVILAAGASQCDTSCMASYDACVITGLAPQVAADDELVYEVCSERLVNCRSGCVNQGFCVMDDGVMVCP